jgi:hypothetical protein
MANTEARTAENYHNNLVNEDGSKNVIAYDDSYVKNQMIIILKILFNWDLYINPDDMGVDLLSVDGTFGVELEHGGWDNNFWEDEHYSRKSKELDYPHVNMPERKDKWYKPTYWVNLEPDKTKKPIFKQKDNPTYKNNIYIRTNRQLTQMIIIRPKTVFEGKFEKKMIYAHNSGKYEPFRCFQRSDVETLDLVNGNWIENKNI